MQSDLIKFPTTPIGKVFKLCPNGALIYTGNRCINYITFDKDKKPIVVTFYTRQVVSEIIVDPKWPIDDSVACKRLFATLYDDNIVQVWDLEKGVPVFGHKAHMQINHVDGMNEKYKTVLMGFMCNHNVMSMDCLDIIVLCCTSHTYIRCRMFINLRTDKLFTLSCSQFNANIFAVGTTRGVVYVCDIQKMVVIQALRGHRETAITSIDWHCFSGNTLEENNSDDKDGILITHDCNYSNNACGQTTKIKSADCISHEEEPKKNVKCHSSEENIMVLNNFSSDGSLEIIGSSSDDDVAVEGEPNLLKTKVLYQVQVHASSGDFDKTDKAENVSEINDKLTTKEEEPKLCVAESKVLEDQENQTNDCNKSAPNENGKLYTCKHRSECEKDTVNQQIVLTSVSTYNGVYCVWDSITGELYDTIKTNGHIVNHKRQLTVNWLNEHTIIGLNKDGEIMTWTCNHPTYDYQRMTINLKFSKDKQLNFNFAADVICYDNERQILWCKGGQRQIICFDWATKKVLANFNSVCNGLYDIKECPDDMNKILLGFCDYTFALLDTVSLSPTNINIQYISRSDIIVNCLTWSPDCLSFAYGTNEGTVGIISIENAKHLFQTNSVGNKPIYTLDWQQENCLYVVYKDKIALMDLKNKTKEAYYIPEFVNSSFISFRGNFAFLGTQSGYLELYRMLAPTKFESIKVIKVQSRYISQIAWSPIATNRFAVVGANSEINIFTFNENSAELYKIYTLTVEIQPYQFSSIKWSNKDGDRFVTCSTKGDVRVWDLSQENKKQIMIQNFSCPMRRAIFLPSDENIVLCCGRNISLETFDIRSNTISSVFSKRVNSIDNIVWATKAQTITSKHKKKSGRKSEIQSTSNVEDNNEDVIDDVSSLAVEDRCDVDTTKTETQTEEHIKSNTVVNAKEPTTVLYLIGKEINKNANYIMLKILDEQGQKDSIGDTCMCAKLFGNKDGLQEIFNAELNQLRASGVTGINLSIIPCLTGNIKDEIIKQMEAKRLTEWHVMMAPKISFSFWEKCMDAFAKQLNEEGKPLQASCAYLAINKTAEAIKILYEQNLFREGFLMARLYLEPDDAIIVKVFDYWVSYLDKTGNFSGASLLCLLSGENKRAYDIISKIRQKDEDVQNIIKILENSII